MSTEDANERMMNVQATSAWNYHVRKIICPTLNANVSALLDKFFILISKFQTVCIFCKGEGVCLEKVGTVGCGLTSWSPESLGDDARKNGIRALQTPKPSFWKKRFNDVVDVDALPPNKNSLT